MEQNEQEKEFISNLVGKIGMMTGNQFQHFEKRDKAVCCVFEYSLQV